jgi:hypothetical protein
VVHLEVDARSQIERPFFNFSIKLFQTEQKVRIELNSNPGGGGGQGREGRGGRGGRGGEGKAGHISVGVAVCSYPRPAY